MIRGKTVIIGFIQGGGGGRRISGGGDRGSECRCGGRWGVDEALGYAASSGGRVVVEEVEVVDEKNGWTVVIIVGDGRGR